jgi:meso-butanediol dehydrogenase/(S,S)-butanediol dehydrogenase/diacetyl reductase
VRLKDKIALVTGAASGIGEASAKTYAREGASLVIVDLNGAAAERVAAEIVDAGGRARALTGDMGERSDIEKMIAFTREQYDRLDILHNNTAWTPVGAAADIEYDDWHKGIDISLTSYWYASKCALPGMIDQGGGAILNTASISGQAADHKLSAYNTVKGGVINLTRSIALDYARQGIRCNAVCPGIIWTPPYQRMKAAGMTHLDEMADSVPMGRFGTPQEIANVALFLVSDEASFVTGACITADGGRTAHTGTPSPLN